MINMINININMYFIIYIIYYIIIIIYIYISNMLHACITTITDWLDANSPKKILFTMHLPCISSSLIHAIYHEQYILLNWSIWEMWLLLHSWFMSELSCHNTVFTSCSHKVFQTMSRPANQHPGTACAQLGWRRPVARWKEDSNKRSWSSKGEARAGLLMNNIHMMYC